MKNFFERVLEYFVCNHNWVFMRRISEQNLRSGFTHDSLVYRCQKCKKMKTLEQPAGE